MFWRVFIAVALAFIMSGCQTGDNKTTDTPIMVEPVEPPKNIQTIDISNPRAKLVMGSEMLVGDIAIMDPKLRDHGALTQSQVTVQNASGTRYTLEYKFDWTDDQGFSVASINSWHRFTLAPREVRTFTSMGKQPNAKNIVFTVRLPDDAFIENYKQNAWQEQQNQEKQNREKQAFDAVNAENSQKSKEITDKEEEQY